MARLISLLLVLATTWILLVEAEALAQQELRIVLRECPQSWKITEQCSNKMLLKIWCWTKENIHLRRRALPWKCSENTVNSCNCLNVTIKSNDFSMKIKKEWKNRKQSEEFIMYKKCCKKDCLPHCKGADFRERLHIKKNTEDSNNLTILVKYKGDCILNDFNNDSDTETSVLANTESMSWIKALQHCHHLNSNLVQINDETVDNLWSLLEDNEALQNGSWIGLERSIFGTNLEWKWTSGMTAQYSDWKSNFSVDPLNNHCGKIVWLKDSEEFELQDENCHKKLPFICQSQP